MRTVFILTEIGFGVSFLQKVSLFLKMGFQCRNENFCNVCPSYQRFGLAGPGWDLECAVGSLLFQSSYYLTLFQVNLFFFFFFPLLVVAGFFFVV